MSLHELRGRSVVEQHPVSRPASGISMQMVWIPTVWRVQFGTLHKNAGERMCEKNWYVFAPFQHLSTCTVFLPEAYIEHSPPWSHLFLPALNLLEVTSNSRLKMWAQMFSHNCVTSRKVTFYILQNVLLQSTPNAVDVIVWLIYDLMLVSVGNFVVQFPRLAFWLNGATVAQKMKRVVQ